MIYPIILTLLEYMDLGQRLRDNPNSSSAKPSIRIISIKTDREPRFPRESYHWDEQNKIIATSRYLNKHADDDGVSLSAPTRSIHQQATSNKTLNPHLSMDLMLGWIFKNAFADTEGEDTAPLYLPNISPVLRQQTQTERIPLIQSK